MRFEWSRGDRGNAVRLGRERAYLPLEGTVEAHGFLLAVAVKRSTRSDRLYQPLFEANVLKYLIEYVLRGAAFRFHVHIGHLTAQMSSATTAPRHSCRCCVAGPPLLRSTN